MRTLNVGFAVTSPQVLITHPNGYDLFAFRYLYLLTNGRMFNYKRFVSRNLTKNAAMYEINCDRKKINKYTYNLNTKFLFYNYNLFRTPNNI